MTESSKDRRDALLGELESIRKLLREDSQHDNIPLLIPEDQKQVSDRIPVLSVVASEEKPDPLFAIRQAAAKVVAGSGRQRSLPEPEKQHEPPAAIAATPTMNDRERLVDDIVRSALPRLEALLRELVQEALLQEKLRGGKR